MRWGPRTGLRPGQVRMSRLSPPRLCPQDQVFQFCCRDCCEDFKRLRGVVSQCEHCRQEKLLHEKLRFSGVEKSFCSEGRDGAGRVAEKRGLGVPPVRGPGLSAQDAPPRPSSGSGPERPCGRGSGLTAVESSVSLDSL